MDGAKEKKQVHIWINAHTNGALHTIYKIKIEQKHSYRHAHTHTYQEIIWKQRSRLAKKDLREIINEKAFVIQHETEYYHCWLDRNIGWIGEKKKNWKT